MVVARFGREVGSTGQSRSPQRGFMRGVFAVSIGRESPTLAILPSTSRARPYRRVQYSLGSKTQALDLSASVMIQSLSPATS